MWGFNKKTLFCLACKVEIWTGKSILYASKVGIWTGNSILSAGKVGIWTGNSILSGRHGGDLNRKLYFVWQAGWGFEKECLFCLAGKLGIRTGNFILSAGNAGIWTGNSILFGRQGGDFMDRPYFKVFLFLRLSGNCSGLVPFLQSLFVWQARWELERTNPRKHSPCMETSRWPDSCFIPLTGM